MSRANITTKTGDNGQSDLRDYRASKGDIKFDLLGSLDELNCWVGVCYKYYHIEFLKEIQRGIGLCLTASYKYINDEDIMKLTKKLEEEINKYDYKFNGFITPSNEIHLARAVCRRAERDVCKVSDSIRCVQVFLNRLSDYLFVLAESIVENNSCKNDKDN